VIHAAQLNEYADDQARLIRAGRTFADRYRMMREAAAAIDDPDQRLRVQLRAKFMDEMKRRRVLVGQQK
jgi:hypothetical protein